MKLIKIFAFLVLFAGAGKSVAANVVEDRHLSGFHAVNVSGSFDVYIVQGASESVKVDAPQDVISHIATEVKNGNLNIYSKGKWSWGNLFSGNKKIVVYVTIRNVDGISLTGSGDVFFKEGINADRLRLALTGSGDLNGKINVKTLESDITGSGDVKVKGHADNAKVGVTGSGDFTGKELNTTNAVVRVGGSGDASVYVTGSLQANVTGSGDIHYGGNPKNIAKSTSGSGDISRF
ncbi:MAG TPA: head GIN domain-containing protein [Mucilaginibacter sp.]|jgi:hypothetical protein|nr:head GIN domain-containing protein [Mucilaginibacter sp.]